MISVQGVLTEPDKIASIARWKLEALQNFSKVRTFPGLNAYYRKFIQNYLTIATPLTILQKDQPN